MLAVNTLKILGIANIFYAVTSHLSLLTLSMKSFIELVFHFLLLSYSSIYLLSPQTYEVFFSNVSTIQGLTDIPQYFLLLAL